jgi:N-acyl-L-homoserine lactone synthetase
MTYMTSPSVRLVASNQRLNDRVAELLERVDYGLAETAEDRDAIFRLRYRAYSREGAIAPNDSGVYSDSFDDTDNAWVFGIHIDGELVASIRLHVATGTSSALPALPVFPDVIGPAIEAGKVVVDPTRFVIDHTASRRFPALCYVTTRLAWLACEYFNADLLLATVRDEHQAFYRRVFGHRPMSEPRHYPSLTKPICMMALDYASERNSVLQRHPFFRSSQFERRMLFAPRAEARLQSAA